MREIKFRAKTLYAAGEQKWVYGLPVREVFGGWAMQVISKNGAPSLIGIDINTLGQFIGLQDGEKVDIYEDDILQGKPHRGATCTQCGHVEMTTEHGVVVWSDYDLNDEYCNNHGQWNLELLWSDYSLLNTFDYKIIGNKHDNPDMMK